MKKGMSDKKIPSLLSPEQDKSDLRQRRELNVSLKNLPGYTRLHHWQFYYCFSGCFRTNLNTYLPSSTGSCEVLPGCRWVRPNALSGSLLTW